MKLPLYRQLYRKLRGERVDIAGRAVEYLRGEITV
jgi:hypothetical protein